MVGLRVARVAVILVAVVCASALPIQAAGYGTTNYYYNDAAHTTLVGTFHIPEVNCDNDGAWSTGVHSDYRYVEVFDECDTVNPIDTYCEEKIGGTWTGVECP